MRARYLTPLLATVVLATGCGDDDTTTPSRDASAPAPAGAATATAAGTSSTGPDATVRGYFGALAERDGAKACALLTKDAQRRAIATVQTSTKKTFKTCGQALAAIVGTVSDANLRQARNVQIAKSTVTGGRATVRVEGGTRDIGLRRTAGRWYIAGGIG